MSKIKRVLSTLLVILKTLLAYPAGRLCYGGKHIWLVEERPNQAQDNGYHFFKYLNTCRPDRRCYYAITKDSPKYQTVADLGDVVPYGSFRNWMLLFGCEAILTTHIWSTVPIDIWRFKEFILKHRPKAQKLVFLQHGVLYADIPSLYSERTGADLFICSAKPEYDYVMEHYHYKRNEVVFTGLARYDALHDFTVKKQILIMPTWRTWLQNLGDGLKDSKYFRQWNQVITDSEFLKAAKNAGYCILFYPHPNMQRYRDCFVSKDESLIIADEYKYEIQTLLKESALLITDFSSVFFDFAYMRKPMLFFHFDKDRYAIEHYQKGYFDHERDGFGKVAYTARELVADFEEILAQGVTLSEEYSRRIDRFFPMYDQKNCERICQAVEHLF
ncbi:MAG: CDP-glycerol glycerophosphotransferase family protein [Clostridia bacterium]|nr:CDP-glycerol glycerophosphotransferase family protein [Clostridia bacterium]